jgi:hypothetical protein
MIVMRVSMQAVQRRQDAAGRKAHAALMQKRDSRMFSCTFFNHKYWLNRLEKLYPYHVSTINSSWR